MGKWDLSSGLPLDDVDVTITAAEFGYNARIQNGEVLCYNVTFTPDDGEEQEQSFSVGKGWTAKAKGQGIEGRKSLNNSTNYGVFCGSLVRAVDAAGKDMDTEFPNEDGFFDAGTFVGSRWHLGTVEVESTNPTTQEKKMVSKVVATAYLGKSGGGEGGGKGAAKAGAGGKAGGKATLKTEDPDLWKLLVKEARKHDDHDDFMEVALSMDEVEGNRLANNAIIDASQVWAAAHPED